MDEKEEKQEAQSRMDASLDPPNAYVYYVLGGPRPIFYFFVLFSILCFFLSDFGFSHGNCRYGNLRIYDCSMKFGIFIVSTIFSNVEPYMDRTIHIFWCVDLNVDRTVHIFSYIEVYMDRTIHTLWYVDLYGPYGPYNVCDMGNRWIVRST